MEVHWHVHIICNQYEVLPRRSTRAHTHYFPFASTHDMNTLARDTVNHLLSEKLLPPNAAPRVLIRKNYLLQGPTILILLEDNKNPNNTCAFYPAGVFTFKHTIWSNWVTGQNVLGYIAQKAFKHKKKLLVGGFLVFSAVVARSPYWSRIEEKHDLEPEWHVYRTKDEPGLFTVVTRGKASVRVEYSTEAMHPDITLLQVLPLGESSNLFTVNDLKILLADINPTFVAMPESFPKSSELMAGCLSSSSSSSSPSSNCTTSHNGKTFQVRRYTKSEKPHLREPNEPVDFTSFGTPVRSYPIHVQV